MHSLQYGTPARKAKTVLGPMAAATALIASVAGAIILLDRLTLRHRTVVVGPSGPSPAPQALYDSGNQWTMVSTTRSLVGT